MSSGIGMVCEMNSISIWCEETAVARAGTSVNCHWNVSGLGQISRANGLRHLVRDLQYCSLATFFGFQHRTITSTFFLCFPPLMLVKSLPLSFVATLSFHQMHSIFSLRNFIYKRASPVPKDPVTVQLVPLFSLKIKFKILKGLENGRL